MNEQNIVESLDELICNIHTKSKIVKLERISGLKTYVCEKCYEDDQYIDPIAYECPKCGIVKGDYIAKVDNNIIPKKDMIFKGLIPLAYHCRLCYEKLGSVVIKISFDEQQQ